MIHLKTISFSTPEDELAAHFPFSVASIRSLFGTRIALNADVTFLVGENGSGKSTFLEAIAAAVGSVAVGSHNIEQDPSLAAIGLLANHMKLSWSKKTKRGFFMRSEDFFGYARRMRQSLKELRQDLFMLNADPTISPDRKHYGGMAFAGQIADLQKRYGEGLDYNSHGEAFFKLFQSRLVPNGLYLMDEPEAPLSPLRQIGLLSLLKTMIEEKQAQFIIATHSPILMAFPGAEIYSFDQGTMRKTAYDELEHVTITRDFLANPARFLRHL